MIHVNNVAANISIDVWCNFDMCISTFCFHILFSYVLAVYFTVNITKFFLIFIDVLLNYCWYVLSLSMVVYMCSCS